MEIVLPGKAERALRYEFVCRMGGPPEFRYCNGEWSKHVENVRSLLLPRALCRLLHSPAVNRDGGLCPALPGWDLAAANSLVKTAALSLAGGDR
jgi:hypothetical protein